MKLLSLRLKNFKGITDFHLDIDGRDADIYGRNGTGKTTICDSIYWLLFEKDSQFKTKFGIKCIDEKGREHHQKDHEVEGVFLVKDQTIKLKKIYREIWTKKRGDARKTFTGHTTEYQIDDIPVNKKEYQKRTAIFFDEEIFKLLTTPIYFSEILPWEKRRDILIDICGDISKADVIKSDEKLIPLVDILKNCSIDDRKKSIKAGKAKINEQLEKIPIRIDEINRGIDVTKSIDEKHESAVIAALETRLETLKNNLINAKAGGVISAKTKKIMNLDADIIQIENLLNKEHQNEINDQNKIINQLNSEFINLEVKHKSLFNDCMFFSKKIEKINNAMNELRTQWYEVERTKFNENKLPEYCVFCLQPIPEKTRAAAYEKALSEFNLQKADELQAINDAGANEKKELELAQESYNKKNLALESCDNDISNLKTRIDIEQKKLSEMVNKPYDFSKNVDYAALIDKKKKLEREIRQLDSDQSDAGEVETIKKEIKEIESKIDQSKSNLLKLKNSGCSLNRIKELKRQEKELSKEFETLEKELFLIESFIKKKVELIEENINKRFNLARFKLFEEQINGGLSDCCIVTYKGIPFNTGLNHGARILVGIDIIRTLQEYYEKTPFILIDNRESITSDINIDNTQIISFIASPDDKKLRIEFKK